VAVTDSAESRIMFTWLLENEVKPDDHLHILHVTVKDPSNAALPGGDYFLQVTSHSYTLVGRRPGEKGSYQLSVASADGQTTHHHVGQLATYVQA